MGFETNPPPASGQIEQTNLQEVLRTFLRLQEQLQATQASIEQNREEARKAAAQGGEALSKGLQALQEAFSAQRARELEVMQSSNQAMQKSNKAILMAAGTFAAIGFLAMLVMSWFQWRTSKVLAEISAALPMLQGSGPGSALAALGPGDSSLAMSSPAEQSNSRLLGAFEQLEKRIYDLEQNSQPGSKPSEARLASGGNGEPAVESDSASATTGSEVCGTDEEVRIAALLGEADSLQDKNNTEAALACLENVLSLNPHHTEALVRKGATLERLHKLNEAIECYDRAIAADGAMTIAYLHKGGLCNRLERFKEALECYEKALRTHEQWSG
jgi:tetratricopeptide (TPR) repeat protein